MLQNRFIIKEDEYVLEIFFFTEGIYKIGYNNSNSALDFRGSSSLGINYVKKYGINNNNYQTIPVGICECTFH